MEKDEVRLKTKDLWNVIFISKIWWRNFKKYKHQIYNCTLWTNFLKNGKKWSWHILHVYVKGTAVNQMYNSVNEGSLKITFTNSNSYLKLKYLICPDKKQKFSLNFKTFYC